MENYGVLCGENVNRNKGGAYVKKGLLYQLIQWGGALLLSMGFISFIVFFYYRPVGWLERDKNATSAVWEPNTVLFNFLEGGGITRVDDHGYTNPGNKALEDDLVLCIGASFVQGKEVMEQEKYTYLLNTMLGGKDKLKVYNLSRDAYVYPEIVAGFSAAIQEFPQTKVVVIDIANTDYPLEELQDALEQREYAEEERGENLYKQLSRKEKVKTKIKDYVPIISVLKYQMLQKQKENTTIDAAKTEEKVSEKRYAKALDATMKQMRKAFSGKIIIMYHPSVSLQKDGSMTLEETNHYATFSKVCKENEIVFADAGEAFLQAYQQRREVPYGFQNTTLGEGHLNKNGHKIIAQQLYSLITKE